MSVYEIGLQKSGSEKIESGISQQMDFSRDSCRIGENGVETEFCSPSPATPIHVAPLPQQNAREASTSCPDSATTGSMHSFEASKAGYELHLASGTPKSLPACAQDGVESESENAPPVTASNELSVGGSQTVETTPVSGAVKHRVGDGSVSGGVGRMGGRRKGALIDEVEVRVASKSSEEEASMSSGAAMERACCDRSMTSMERPSWSVKTEGSELALDAGLSLGSEAVQFAGWKEGSCIDLSRAWKVGGSAGGSGDCFVGSSGEEGAVVLRLSEGRGGSAQVEKGEVGMGGEWRGKHVQLSIGLEAEERVGGGRVGGGVEHCFRQVLEQNAGGHVEDGAKVRGDWSDDRLTKRVKREVVETRLIVDESREQIWKTSGDEGGRRSWNDEKKQEEVKSPIWGNGGAGFFLQRYREKAFGKVLEVGNGEPKTMVVKKTPKRVHNSDPSAMFTKSELLMLEDSIGSPFTPSNKQGIFDAMHASNLAESANQRLYRESATLVCGRERGVRHSRGILDGRSVLQSQLESRLDGGSLCTLMSTPQNPLLIGDPSLPLSLNFSPKPQRPVSISKASTEEEWGKSLALCGPGAESTGVVERSSEEAKVLSFQERFVQLQVFLKKCDEDDQSYLLDGLRSLSAAGRSSYAVGLEQRALWLSVEEGKEMTRLKSLNVMGPRKGQNEVGCTPEGPRVASFGRGGEHSQQQTSTSMRSPQMHMQMVMSGSMPSSAYKESYHPG